MPPKKVPMIVPYATKGAAESAYQDMLLRGYKCTEVIPIPEELESIHGEGWYFKAVKGKK